MLQTELSHNALYLENKVFPLPQVFFVLRAIIAGSSLLCSLIWTLEENRELAPKTQL